MHIVAALVMHRRVVEHSTSAVAGSLAVIHTWLVLLAVIHTWVRNLASVVRLLPFERMVWHSRDKRLVAWVVWVVAPVASSSAAALVLKVDTEVGRRRGTVLGLDIEVGSSLVLQPSLVPPLLLVSPPVVNSPTAPVLV